MKTTSEDNYFYILTSHRKKTISFPKAQKREFILKTQFFDSVTFFSIDPKMNFSSRRIEKKKRKKNKKKESMRKNVLLNTKGYATHDHKYNYKL